MGPPQRKSRIPREIWAQVSVLQNVGLVWLVHALWTILGGLRVEMSGTLTFL